MKKLVLIRHAKSSWKHDMADFDRPLNNRGTKDAPLMGKLLKQKGVFPNQYLASPAKRAITTAKLICEGLEIENSVIKTEESIYLASYQKLLTIISKQKETINTLFITGHNPGFTDLANIISEARIDNLPTCGIFAVDFNIAEWAEVTNSKGRFSFFEYPKKHN